VPSPVRAAVLGPPRGHRDLRPGTRSPRPGPGHRHPPPVHDRGVYRYAVEEELLDHSPAAHVRRPRLDYESHATALDPNEVGALLVAAGLGAAAEHALISLLALNGLRVSEAIGADIEHLGLERGHRTLVITRKGGKVVTIPLAPRTARAIDLAIGERTSGPLFIAADGKRLDRHGAARIVRRVTRRAGVSKQVSPHTLRHAFITAAPDAGVPLRDVQEAASHADPRTTMRYDRARTSLDRQATYIAGAAR
jgi:integrase/recombinase XerD